VIGCWESGGAFDLRKGILGGGAWWRASGLAAGPVAEQTWKSYASTDAPDMLYRQHCAVCHGENGDGKSQAALVLDPPPKDFTAQKTRNESSRAHMLEARQDLAGVRRVEPAREHDDVVVEIEVCRRGHGSSSGGSGRRRGLDAVLGGELLPDAIQLDGGVPHEGARGVVGGRSAQPGCLGPGGAHGHHGREGRRAGPPRPGSDARRPSDEAQHQGAPLLDGEEPAGSRVGARGRPRLGMPPPGSVGGRDLRGAIKSAIPCRGTWSSCGKTARPLAVNVMARSRPSPG